MANVHRDSTSNEKALSLANIHHTLDTEQSMVEGLSAAFEWLILKYILNVSAVLAFSVQSIQFF